MILILQNKNKLKILTGFQIKIKNKRIHPKNKQFNKEPQKIMKVKIVKNLI